MRKMKDSGIEWIGEIPQEWEVIKLSFLFNEIGSGTTPPVSYEQYYDGDIYWVNTGDLNDNYLYETNKTITKEALDRFSTLRLYDVNSIIVAMYGATIGKIAISKIKFTTNQACCVLSQPLNCNSIFIYYWFLQNRENIISLSYGGGQPNISQEVIRSLKIQIPSFEEQSKIVKYLDIKCDKIDAIIKAKKITNKKLKEYRQSIIYEAVTKGLDKNAPMRDSGIEWIGEIPENWKLKKLKHVSLNIVEKNTKKNHLMYIGLEHIESKLGGLVNNYEPIYDFYGETIHFDINNVLYGKLRPYLAKVYFSTSEGKCSSEFFVLKPYGLYSKYLFYLTLSKGFVDIVDSSTYGVKMPRAEWGFVGNLKVPVPFESEQKQIADYLDKRCAEIDSVIAANDKTIEKLKEYRQSVIYEAVTGKTEIL